MNQQIMNVVYDIREAWVRGKGFDDSYRNCDGRMVGHRASDADIRGEIIWLCDIFIKHFGGHYESPRDRKRRLHRERERDFFLR